ncbi:cysteine-rich receptor-like protein kinase 44 isoform X2 [Cornus florida]|uniref:cysteine-rich receptor-like protein kinase 44 isoform X2 n=1 Tax=Cornus florida TaxID=4283 RepID=UPI002896B90F|nr:cysteine-rich receptor-like protein kinase 44 isoform X2 [Cornus florida]
MRHTMLIIPCWRQLFFISHILTSLVGVIISQPDFLYQVCSGSGNYTSNSIYKANLDSLLSSLASDTDIAYGFYNSSYGENSDRVNAIALCRGDVELHICRSCVNDSTAKLTQLCPNQKEAIGWYDNCMLRYSNRSISHNMEYLPAFYMWNQNNVSNVDQFNQSLRTLLDSLKGQAASGGSARKFATGNRTGPDFQTVYALVQCTPDLSDLQCINCLDEAAGDIPVCCNGKRGGRVVAASCNLRFEVNRFYNDTIIDAPSPPPIPTSPPLSPPPPPGKDSNTARTVIIIVVPTVIIFVLVIIGICIYLRKREQRKPTEEAEDMDEIRSVESLQYDFETVRVATDNFSDSNKLGQGGFGAVYKGRFSNGEEIAVKRLSRDSGQGEQEFKNEVMLVAKLQHRNLVRLLGFCLSGTERLLVYEFMPNSSLDHFIFDPLKRAHLDWDRRYKIIGGISRGLLYLHEDSRLRIIHRDLKTSNVLLDTEMNPKISDFGMARLFAPDETQGNTSRIVGTYGYMAPEYAMHGHFSIKSDVFSFGVLVLEIITGQRNNCFRNGENVEDLLSYAWKNWRDGTASNLIDSTLRAVSSSMGEIMRCIHIGLLCVQENEADRPTMASVVLMLSSFSLTLSVPSEPAFFMHSRDNPEMPLLREYDSGVTDSSQSKSISTSLSANQASITDLYPR